MKKTKKKKKVSYVVYWNSQCNGNFIDERANIRFEFNQSGGEIRRVVCRYFSYMAN